MRGRARWSAGNSMHQPPDLWSVRCFLAVAEELHFGRASNRLNTTQPTLSQQVRKLEAKLGVRLFVRSTRNVELTAAGEIFRPLAKEILTKLQEAVVLSRLAAGGTSAGGEQLIVGAIEPAVHRLLPRILRRFQSRFPETRLDLKVCDSLEILRALERGEYHVGIMREPANTNLLRFRALLSDRFVAVIPAHLPLTSQPVLHLRDFVGRKVFTLDRFDLSIFRDVHDQLTAIGITLDQRLRPSNTMAALALASAGAGVTFLPSWVGGIASSDVVVRPVDDLQHEITLGIGWRADNPAPGIMPFVDLAELVSRTS